MSTEAERRLADAEDLAEARKEASGAPEERPWYRSLGPGLITGAADDDPSGVATYSANGAQFGTSLFWLVPFCIPLMIAVQEMCARLAAVTGNGIAAVLKKHYAPVILYGCVVLLVGANVFNIYADLNVMAASTQMLFGLPLKAGLLIITALLVVTQIAIPYRVYAKVLKWLCLALLGYVVVVFMPGVKNDWAAIVSGLTSPHMDAKPETILAVVAFLGTTISPYLFFWQAGETVEVQIAEDNADKPGKRKTPVTEQEVRRLRVDTITGMVASQLVALFIMIAAASTLHARGITQIETAQDAAKALQPLGPAAYWIFSLCIIGTGLLAIPTLAGSVAYSVAETVGWRYGLYRRFSRARAFYLTVGGVIVAGCVLNFIGVIKPVTALVYSAALNGIIAPPLIVVLLFICNNSQIMKERTNRFWSNAISGLTVVLMGAAAAYLIYAVATHKM